MLPAMSDGPVIHGPTTDTMLAELRPSPGRSAAARAGGGEDAGDGLVIHHAPDGQPWPMPPELHLAQLNVARPRAPLDSPVMAEFMANLERVNALGDASPGFVWRLQGEDGNATEREQPFGPEIIVNMTVWRDVESLRAFVFRGEHVAFLCRRGEWFTKLDGRPTVLWWVPAGHPPTLDEAKRRLERLARGGPTPAAFTFAHAFGADRLPLRRAVA
jgi:Domain of unknown function (DUF3291)